MNAENNNRRTLYESNPTVAGLNKVPGFDPLKLLRRTKSAKTQEPVMRLDLPYKKLWFRLANPHGRIRVNALRVTEQLAVYEAQIYLNQNDPQPVGAFTASCTKEIAPDGRYIEAAQREAINEALSDAGYGLQFADVTMRPEDRRYGSEVPVAAVKQSIPAAPPSAPAQAAIVEPSVQIANSSTALAQPVPQAIEPARPEPAPVETLSVKKENVPSAEAPAAPVQPVNEAVQKPLPTTETPQPVPPYTQESPVEEILRHLTPEQAKEVVVDVGVCSGWTLGEVAQKRPASLKYYIFNGYKGKNNLLRAAARLVYDSLTAQKAA